MLLIIGKHAERLPNIHHIAAKTHMQLEVARNGAALKAAFAGSRRTIVVLDEQDLDDEFGEALSSFADEPHFKLLVLPRGRTASSASCVRLSGFNAIHWLKNDVSDKQLTSIVKAYRSEMLKVRRQELQQAFVNREFIIQYQPKVAWIEAENRWQTTEAEALIRWRHPTHGLLGPRHFLPEAEQAGYMEQISELVLRNVMRQVKRWDENGLSLIGCVNLCPSMLDLKPRTT
ncbi:MAG: EAL domain-containing protein [Pseudomonadota bacterium]